MPSCTVVRSALTGRRLVTAVFLIAGMAGFGGGCQLVSRNQPPVSAQVACRQLTQQGITAMAEGNWTLANEHLAKAVETCPADPDARQHYADALWHSGQREAALAQLDEALRLAPEDAEVLLRAARYRFEVGQFEAAEKLTSEALDLDPHLAEAWATRAQVMQQRGRLAEALSDYQRALQYDSRRADWWLRVAGIYRAMNRPQQALANLESLCELYVCGEEPPDVLDQIAQAYAALGRYEEAIETYRLAVQHGAQGPGVWYRQAEAYWALGRGPEAQASLAQALALEPNHAASRALLARIEQQGAATTRRQ